MLYYTNSRHVSSFYNALSLSLSLSLWLSLSLSLTRGSITISLSLVRATRLLPPLARVARQQTAQPFIAVAFLSRSLASIAILSSPHWLVQVAMHGLTSACMQLRNSETGDERIVVRRMGLMREERMCEWRGVLR